MPVIARKKQAPAQDRIRAIVAEHLEMLEPGLSVLETSLRLGRTTIDVVAVDAKGVGGGRFEIFTHGGRRETGSSTHLAPLRGSPELANGGFSISYTRPRTKLARPA